MQKIKQMIDRIKNWLESEKGKDILIVIIVILVGLASFELGRLSKENDSSGIKIEYPSRNTTQAANVVSSAENAKVPENIGKTFFASSRGTKYYSIGCSAGKNLKQENRVYFETREEAEKAGYALSAMCQ